MRQYGAIILRRLFYPILMSYCSKQLCRRRMKMSLNKLTINGVRNIQSVTVEPGEKFNVFFGENGSGKTSLLEAIHILGIGRSFRTINNNKLISFQQPHLSVFGMVSNGFQVGVEKHRNGENRIRVNAENKSSAAALAEILPLQILNAHIYYLLDKGAKLRQQFLDWGLFHVEPQFLFMWRQVNRAIKHRNMALRQGLSQNQIIIWDQDIVRYGECINQWRYQYMQSFIPLFRQVLGSIIDIDVDIKYMRGWNEDIDLQVVLEKDFLRDFELGYSQHGPHRADLRIMSNSKLAKDTLSRGEQKVVLYAMKLAQGMLMYELTEKPCIYLIDDLAAELDAGKRQVLADILTGINAQTFVTGVDKDALGAFFTAVEARLFHVKQGGISSYDP